MNPKITKSQTDWIENFIWGIADDVLRDLFKRGKYPDVILPMAVIRRFDAVLEPKKQEVLNTKAMLDTAGITEQRAALCSASGQAFYNTSKFSLRDLRSRSSQKQLRDDFEDYLDGFSPNVQDIIDNFKFRNQIPTLSKADAIGTLIAKLLDPEINLSPNPVYNSDGSIKHPGLDNHAMGTIFEGLVRRFNEENNEEAGEHWTPRDAVKLMTNLIFQPIAETIQPGSYLLYDGACGTGGMLTLAEETLVQLAEKQGKRVNTYLYGQEINPETFAICKADMLLKGEGENADNIVGGAEYSTLANDAFRSKEFDFMLSNPPYGKSWKKDLERLGGEGGKTGVKDARFVINYAGQPDYSLVTRTSDGQLLFLANMVSKMNHKSALGSRIASVHNGSSLFTGDAGQGESNIRRWIIENDWVEAIIALPLNFFYNTGIATYIWLLTNRKPEHRKGFVQLIDASGWSVPLRKNLGKKNCEFSETDIQRITDTYLAFKETEQSKIFPNQALGYWKIVVERPLRLHSRFTVQAIESLRFSSGDEAIRTQLYEEFGEVLFTDFTSVEKALTQRLANWNTDEDTEETEEEEASKPKGLPEKKKKRLLERKTWERDGQLIELATALMKVVGDGLFTDYNRFKDRVNMALMELGKRKPSATDLKIILRAVSWREETAPPVWATVHKANKKQADPLRGLFAETLSGKPVVVEYEPDPTLRDTEQIPLLEEGGIEAFLQREVLPYTPDAWLKDEATRIGYEISFTRHFYKTQPLRTLAEIGADIKAIEHEALGLLNELLRQTVAI
nr:class I SAM-dependent DNA methyltransferase [uncultured Dyadobacter sp.]